MTEFQLALFVVFIFSIVQSVIGIGLLVFGTPTFLLLGFDFDVAISYLLPASIGISCLQGYNDRIHVKLGKEFFVFTVPCIILGLAFVLSREIDFDVKIFVGTMLIASGIMRHFSRLQAAIKHFLKNHMKVYLVVMGLIHGFSNMGGGLLAILSSGLFESKKEIRANIAYSYIVFTVTQMLVLVGFRPELFNFKSFAFPAVSIFVYLVLGNFIFNKSSDKLYHKLITIFIFTYGIVLLVPIDKIKVVLIN